MAPALRTEWLRGALVGRDGFRRTPAFPAVFARHYYGGFEHFAPGWFLTNATYAGYTVIAVPVGTLAMSDEVGGWLKLVGGADGQGIQMQQVGETWLPTALKDIWFEASIKVDDGDDQDWFVGMASTDADIFAGDPTELIAFRGVDASANIDFQVRNGGAGAQVDTGTDMGDGTAVRLGFHVDGITRVVPYINGVAQTAVTTNIPTAEMCLTFGGRSGGTTANGALYIDWHSELQPQ